jgi:predicted metal-dependent hydrolase
MAYQATSFLAYAGFGDENELNKAGKKQFNNYALMIVSDMLLTGYAGVREASVAFNHSKFKIAVNPDVADRNQAIEKALERFSRDKAKLKISPRIEKWSQITGLVPTRYSFRKLDKRWGNCTSANEIIINYDAIKLPFTAIDYIIVHELAHIKHRQHSKDFDKEVAKFIPDWKDVDKRLCGMKL